MSIIALASNTLAGSPASGQIEYDGNFYATDSNSARGQLERITQSTAVSASGTSVNFTGIPAWAKRITVMFNGVSFNATTTPIVQLGDSGGIETSGYSGIAGTISTTANTTGGQSSTTSGMLLYSGTIAAAEFITGTITICLLGSNAWTFSGTLFSGSRATTLAGSKTLSDVLTQIRITTVNGTDTFDAGTINVMWEG